MSRNNLIILAILIIGALFRLIVTSDGYFLFNMDNARDMVDVREMVELKKPRLIGPTSAIEGFYNGPGWYYLLAIPYVLSGGDPYASILMEIVLWAIGGYFLLKLVSRWGNWLMVPIGALWISSNYIFLTTSYAFNPNPLTLLTPLLIYLLVKYLEKEKLFLGISLWFLAGLFFNFEMNFAIFIPAIIFLSIIFSKKIKMFKSKAFWIGFGVFILTLLPQVLFDLKHQFIMTNSIIKYLSENSGPGFDPLKRLQIIPLSFFNTFVPTMMNQKLLSQVLLISFFPVLLKFIQEKTKESLVLVTLLYIFVPFLGYLILPVNVNPWHLGGAMAGSLILIAYLLKNLFQLNLLFKSLSLIIVFFILFFALKNISNYFFVDRLTPSLDPSLYENEISAIDYVYKVADGKNFKVYIYLPSVYDYPYQYLFWWYGQKTYGYIPGEYAYLPNKPEYISNKHKFEGRKDNFSELVFLIKEPDRIKMRESWEDNFENLEFVSKESMGGIEVEVRKQLKVLP